MKTKNKLLEMMIIMIKSKNFQKAKIKNLERKNKRMSMKKVMMITKNQRWMIKIKMKLWKLTLNNKQL